MLWTVMSVPAGWFHQDCHNVVSAVKCIVAVQCIGQCRLFTEPDHRIDSTSGRAGQWTTVMAPFLTALLAMFYPAQQYGNAWVRVGQCLVSLRPGCRCRNCSTTAGSAQFFTVTRQVDTHKVGQQPARKKKYFYAILKYKVYFLVPDILFNLLRF